MSRASSSARVASSGLLFRGEGLVAVAGDFPAAGGVASDMAGAAS
eukprot:CAMPEP_0197913256 /NCGR_PEP_ID=MMETSP1439-20131203/76323_1 /TAXON_ID=66791 /ORGANISM="Gonyaulax spinifera, Strain CCMP409" /LENGTH=44 /DNA_ID= /DNA_START= /DNA_END= /DNA_ORIENTATION=